jgi:hypothetical protein
MRAPVAAASMLRAAEVDGQAVQAGAMVTGSARAIELDTDGIWATLGTSLLPPMPVPDRPR